MRQRRKSALTDQQRQLVDSLDRAETEIDRQLPARPLAEPPHQTIRESLARRLAGFVKNPRSGGGLILAGPRGVGKTTLLAQLYRHSELDRTAKFYLSLDQPRLAGVDPDDILAAVATKLGRPPSRARQPILIFVDEPPLSPAWLAVGRALARRRSRLLLVAASSTDPGRWRESAGSKTARQIVRIGPLSLAEANFIKATAAGEISAGGPWPVDHLVAVAPADAPGRQLRAALLGGGDSFDVYSRLKRLEPELDRYWQGQPPAPAIAGYLAGDHLPEALAAWQTSQRQQFSRPLPAGNLATRIRAQARRQLDRTCYRDPTGRRRLISLLRRLANADPAGTGQLGRSLDLSPRTLAGRLRRLVDAALMTELPGLETPGGRPATAGRYLFALAGLRQALSRDSPDRLRPRLVDDIAAAYLVRLADGVDGTVSGDDDGLILTTRTGRVAITTATGQPKPAAKSPARKLPGQQLRYRLALTDGQLQLDEPDRTVFVPLATFLLL